MKLATLYFWMLLFVAGYSRYAGAPTIDGAVFLSAALVVDMIGELIDAVKGKS